MTTINPERLRLLASIGFNLIAKLPSIASLLFILPIISHGLGPSLYGEFLAMLALGTMCTLFFGGINTVTRRRLSFAHASGDIPRECAVVSSAISAAAIIVLIAGAAVGLIATLTASSPSLVVVALTPLAAAFANTFDNIRAAYNQHYITAILQTIAQCVIFGFAFYSGVGPSAVIFSALVLYLPYISASICTFIALKYERPELRFVLPTDLRETFKAAAYVVLADGATTSALNASLYGLGALGATEGAAWYGTLMRAFQTLLAPVLLILLPMTSFVAIRWANWEATTRRKAIGAVGLIALLYGCFVGLSVAIGGNYYLQFFFPWVPVASSDALACVGFFFGTIIAQKIYVQLIYSVDEARGLSLTISASVFVGLLAGIASSAWVAPLYSLEVFAIATSIPLLAAILVDQTIRRQSLSRVSFAS